MSLVVAIRDKDRIVLGADKQSSAGGNKDHNATKIWPLKDLDGALLGSVGSMRGSQIVQYSKIIDKNSINDVIDTEFVITSLAPTLLALLEGNGVNCKLEDKDSGTMIMMPNDFIFAYEDTAWMIWRDLSVSEIPDYLAIGSGSDIAKGALFATKDKDPFTRISTSIDAAAKATLFVDDEIDILATDFYDEDFEPYAEAVKMSPNEKKDFMKFVNKMKKAGKAAEEKVVEEKPKKEKVKVAEEVEAPIEDVKPKKKSKKEKIKADAE